MHRAKSLPLARIRTAASWTVLFCALSCTGTAGAQSLDPQFPASPQDSYSQSAYGGPVTQGPGTRGIFVATVATLIAQSLGSGVGTALAQGIGESITRWFSGEPSPSNMVAGKSFAAQVDNDQDTRATLHAGVAYEVHLIGRDGATRAINPARHVFRTNDRFQVYYRPTLPGRVNVLNVNPRGSESHIDTAEVAAGQLAVLGPYQFVDVKGDETLKLVLEPCSSPSLTARTRGIVGIRTGAAADPSVRLGDCGDARTRGMRAKTRTIRKTTMEGATAFALDQVSKDELKSGLVGAREVQISLHHR